MLPKKEKSVKYSRLHRSQSKNLSQIVLQVIHFCIVLLHGREISPWEESCVTLICSLSK